jgi:hypothetical protein
MEYEKPVIKDLKEVARQCSSGVCCPGKIGT